MRFLLMIGSTLLVLIAAVASYAQQTGSTQVAGGSGGSAFSDPAPQQGARILEVRVRVGEQVDSVQFLYGLPNGSSYEGPRHGGGGGTLNTFRLDSDEYLVGISGRSGDFIDSISFQTNKRTSPVFGGRGGSRDYNLQVPEGNQATGFTGRSGNYLDAIGLTYARRSFTFRLPGSKPLNTGRQLWPVAEAVRPSPTRRSPPMRESPRSESEQGRGWIRSRRFTPCPTAAPWMEPATEEGVAISIRSVSTPMSTSPGSPAGMANASIACKSARISGRRRFLAEAVAAGTTGSTSRPAIKRSDFRGEPAGGLMPSGSTMPRLRRRGAIWCPSADRAVNE